MIMKLRDKDTEFLPHKIKINECIPSLSKMKCSEATGKYFEASWLDALFNFRFSRHYERKGGEVSKRSRQWIKIATVI